MDSWPPIEPFVWMLSPLSHKGLLCPVVMGSNLMHLHTYPILLPQITIHLLCHLNLDLFSWMLPLMVSITSHDFATESSKLVVKIFGILSCLVDLSSKHQWDVYDEMAPFFAFLQRKVQVDSKSDQHQLCCRDIWLNLHIIRLWFLHELFCWWHHWFPECFCRAFSPWYAFLANLR